MQNQTPLQRSYNKFLYSHYHEYWEAADHSIRSVESNTLVYHISREIHHARLLYMVEQHNIDHTLGLQPRMIHELAIAYDEHTKYRG